jgi:hypothetical protein
MRNVNITGYLEAKSFYDNHIKDQSGKYEGCHLGNNTRLVKRTHPKGDLYAVKLHGTDVVTYHPDGNVDLNNGGWETSVTKRRINQHTPRNISITQDAGQWYLKAPDRVAEPFDRKATVSVREPSLA